jgi:hypothetical protein
MSTLVELPPEKYNLNAFDNFEPTLTNFTIENARALMWFSQLAYETGRPETIRSVSSASWHFDSVSPFARRQVGIPTNFETCGIIGERLNAVVLAFAGTNPAVWENLATDFDIEINEESNTHHGFQAALGRPGNFGEPTRRQAALHCRSQFGCRARRACGTTCSGRSRRCARSSLCIRHAACGRRTIPGGLPSEAWLDHLSARSWPRYCRTHSEVGEQLQTRRLFASMRKRQKIQFDAAFQYWLGRTRFGVGSKYCRRYQWPIIRQSLGAPRSGPVRAAFPGFAAANSGSFAGSLFDRTQLTVKPSKACAAFALKPDYKSLWPRG